MTDTLNTLLGHTPAFESLTPDNATEMVEQALAQGNAMVHTITHTDYVSAGAFLDAVTEVSVLIGKVWGPIQHLFMVNNPRWETVYQSLLPKIVQFWNQFNQNAALYQQYKHFDEQPVDDPEIKRALHIQKKEFEHAGIGLPEQQKKQCADYIERSTALQTTFAQNHLRCKDHFCHFVTDAAELAGLPKDFIALAKDKATQKGRPDAWAIGIDDRAIEAVLKHADHRPLRARIHQAYMTQASPTFIQDYQGEASWDNTAIVAELLSIRQKMAELLSYPHFAALALSERMAQNSDTVEAFLQQLIEHAKPKAEAERAALIRFAEEELQIRELAAHDIRYVSEKMRETQFDIKEEEVRAYFPLAQVLTGLSHICRSVFHITIEDSDLTADRWHKDAQIKRIADADTQETIGYLYLDLLAREGKSSGAWMNEACTTTQEKPIAYLTCNFSPSTAESPTLLSHNDVLTFAHELGHSLNHLLNRSRQWSLFGNRGMEWDAVELQSQFMENFCWDQEGLTSMSRHYQTGETLPTALYEKLIRARHFMTGAAMMRQIEFALFDISLHARPDTRPVIERLAEVRQQTSVFPTASYDRFPLFFDHIFAGGYAAGYYGYHWAEQLSSDVFAAFEENPGEQGILSSRVGPKLRQEIYEQSGGRPAMACFVAFRGREPTIDALLRHRGLTEAAEAHPRAA